MTNFTLLARDRFVLTKQALDSLTQAGTEGMTITILDDRSDQPTRDLLETYGALRNIKPIGTGQARNIVIAASEQYYGRGDYLYLSDNDVYFQPLWLPAMVRVYEFAERYGFKVIGAYNHPFHHPVFTLPVQHPLLGGQLLLIHEVNALATQSMLMRWEVWDKYGPFCQTPVDKVCQSEDVDFTNKIRADGGKLGVVSPALVVNCGITNSFGEHIPGWEMVKRQAPAGVIVE